MCTLPFTLPDCGQPATERIEIYSDHCDRYGSLDASVYACPKHVDDIALTVMAAGLDPHPLRMAPDVTRPCGYVHVYPTGALGGAR